MRWVFLCFLLRFVLIWPLILHFCIGTILFTQVYADHCFLFPLERATCTLFCKFIPLAPLVCLALSLGSFVVFFFFLFFLVIVVVVGNSSGG